jgi:hypothetical protein
MDLAIHTGTTMNVRELYIGGAGGSYGLGLYRPEQIILMLWEAQRCNSSKRGLRILLSAFTFAGPGCRAAASLDDVVRVWSYNYHSKKTKEVR